MLEKIDYLNVTKFNQIGNYKIEKKLSTDILYDIYLVIKEEKQYIIKLYHNYNFKAETIDILINLTQSLSEKIVNIIEIEKDKTINRWYQVLEYIKYGSIKNIQFKNLSLNKIKIIIKELLVIINSLHIKNITNLNFKQKNILIKNIKPLQLVLSDIKNPDEISKLGNKSDDYFFLGLLLFELFYFENANLYEIYSTNTSIDDSLKHLLKGLLTKESAKRWGYEEVILWFKQINIKDKFELEDFIVNERIINDETLKIYFDRYKFNTADDNEKQIVEFLFNGKLENLYDKYKKNFYKKYSLYTNLKKIKNHYNSFDDKLDFMMFDKISKYLEIINNKEDYILPNDFHLDNFSLFQIDYIISKEKFESLKNNPKIKDFILEKLINCSIIQYISTLKFLDKIDCIDLYYIPFDFYNKLDQNFEETIVISNYFIKKDEIDSMQNRYFLPNNIFKQIVNILTLNSIKNYKKSIDYIKSLKESVLIDDFVFIEKLENSKELLKNIKLDFDVDLTIEDLQKIKNIKDSNINFNMINKISKLKESNNKSVNVYLFSLKNFKIKWSYVDKEIVDFFDRSFEKRDNNIDITIFGTFISFLLYLISPNIALVSVSIFVILFIVNNFLSFIPSMPENLKYQNRILEVYKKMEK